MIGRTLRKALLWTAAIYVLFNVLAAGMQIVEVIGRHEAYATPWHFPMLAVSALAASLVQAGILLALLSIDRRLQLRSEAAGSGG